VGLALQRSVVEACAQQEVSQAQGAGHALGAALVEAQAARPAEAGGARFEGGCDVAQPQRAPGSVPEKVQAEQAQLILGAGHLSPGAAQLNAPG